MSLSSDGFWKAGFWSESFWADGFWAEGAGSSDTTIPVITLTGNAIVYVVENGTYNEPGATALDDTDGVLSVTIGGDTVDPSTIGVYSVTYNVDDAAGNSATQVTRSVRVRAAIVSTGGIGPITSIVKSCVTNVVTSVT